MAVCVCPPELSMTPQRVMPMLRWAAELTTTMMTMVVVMMMLMILMTRLMRRH